MNAVEAIGKQALGGLGVDIGDWASSVAVVVLVAPILLGMQSSISRLDQHERNAGRYRITEEHLEEVRESAEEGDRDKVFQFVKRVHELVSTEHQEWLRAWGDDKGQQTGDNGDNAQEGAPNA